MTCTFDLESDLRTALERINGSDPYNYYKYEYTKEEADECTLEYFEGDALATQVWTSKYALKELKEDGTVVYLERSPVDMFYRLSAEIYRAGLKYENPLSFEEIYSLLYDFKYIIPQGSPMAGIGSKDAVSLSNCFVVGYPGNDSYGTILRIDEELVQISKRRGGVGTDISDYRAHGAKVNNAAITSSGAVDVAARRFSDSIRRTGQGGRRGALMLSCNIDSGNVEEFIDSKTDTTSITGANISVKMSDAFMENVTSDNPDPEKLRLWKKIIKNATNHAEPGVLFWDTILRESPADIYKDFGFGSISTNPCLVGETKIMLADGNGKNSIKTFKELAEEGKDIPVYSENEKTGCIEIKMMREPRVTGHKPIFKITLENGASFRGTENHKFKNTDGDWVEIGSMEIGTELIGALNSIDVKNSKGVQSMSGGFGHKIVSIEPDGIEDVYNGTVDDNHNYFVGAFETVDESGSPVFYNILSKNCGEIPLSPYDSCRLLVINKYSYVDKPFTPEAKFNFDLFKKHAKIATKIMDNIVDLEIEKIDMIIEKVKQDPEPENIKETELSLWAKIKHFAEVGRRLGLGFTGEGDMVAALGLRYATKESTSFQEKVQQAYATAVYEASYELVINDKRPAFGIFDYNLEKDHPFLNRIADLSPTIRSYWESGIGRRHIALQTVAPTGSVSIMTKTTSGIEPLYAPSFMRKRKIDKAPGITPDFIDETGDWFLEYRVVHEPFVKWYAEYITRGKVYSMTIDSARERLSKMKSSEFNELFEKSPYYKATAQDCDYVESARLQGVMQLYIDHSISKTSNLPKGTSEDIVRELYETAWRDGCKGFTVYVDGSRDGILTLESNRPVTSLVHNAPKRPKSLPASVIRFSNRGEKWVAIIGLLENEPYEIFTGRLTNFQIPPSIQHGKIIRIPKQKLGTLNSRYDFVFDLPNGSQNAIEDIGHVFDPLYHNYSKLLSGILRHGMPVNHVIATINGLSFSAEDRTINSWQSGVTRALRKYIDQLDDSKDHCPECNSGLKYEDGCKTCPSCGWTAC